MSPCHNKGYKPGIADERYHIFLCFAHQTWDPPARTLYDVTLHCFFYKDIDAYNESVSEVKNTHNSRCFAWKSTCLILLLFFKGIKKAGIYQTNFGKITKLSSWSLFWTSLFFCKMSTKYFHENIPPPTPNLYNVCPINRENYKGEKWTIKKKVGNMIRFVARLRGQLRISISTLCVYRVALYLHPAACGFNFDTQVKSLSEVTIGGRPLEEVVGYMPLRQTVYHGDWNTSYSFTKSKLVARLSLFLSAVVIASCISFLILLLYSSPDQTRHKLRFDSY